MNEKALIARDQAIRRGLKFTKAQPMPATATSHRAANAHGQGTGGRWFHSSGINQDAGSTAATLSKGSALARKNPTLMVSLDINEVIREAVLLVRREVSNQGASMRMELAPALPAVLGDRIQLQQVVVNLVMNGVDAMATITDRPREILIQSQPHETREVLVAVRDSGIGIDSESADRLFNAFFTTKPSGMGMGLSISRSIIMAHGGKLWASPNAEHGAAFQFTVPIDSRDAS